MLYKAAHLFTKYFFNISKIQLRRKIGVFERDSHALFL